MGRTRFRLQTDGQTDARAIAISPEPFGRGIKMLSARNSFSALKVNFTFSRQKATRKKDLRAFLNPF